MQSGPLLVALPGPANTHLPAEASQRGTATLGTTAPVLDITHHWQWGITLLIKIVHTAV